MLLLVAPVVHGLTEQSHARLVPEALPQKERGIARYGEHDGGGRLRRVVGQRKRVGLDPQMHLK
jgi:hypothetical protein